MDGKPFMLKNAKYKRQNVSFIQAIWSTAETYARR